MLNQVKNKIFVKPAFMTHFKNSNAIYSKVVFCDLVNFRSKHIAIIVGLQLHAFY